MLNSRKVIMKNVFKLLPAALGLLALASCNSDDFGTADKVDLTGKAVLEVVDGDDGQMRSFKTASLSTQWVTGDVLRTYDGKMQEYYNFDYATSEGSSGKFVNGTDDLSKFDPQYVLYGVKAANMSYAGWKDGKNIALLKVENTYSYEENEGTTTGYKSILPMLGKVTEIDKSGDKPQLKATMFTLVARAKVTFKNGKGANVKRVRARALKFNDGKGIEDVNFAKEATTVTADGSEIKDKFSEIATKDGAPKLNGWFEAVLDKDIKASTTDGGLQPCEAVVNNSDATNEITVVVNPANMKDYTNCVFFPIAPGNYDIIVFEYSTKDEDVTENEAVNWQYIGYATGNIDRTWKMGDFGTDNKAANDLTIETTLQVSRDNIQNTEALTAAMAEHNNANAAVELTINGGDGSQVLKTLDGDETQYTIYIPQLKNNMTVNVKGKTNLTGKALIIKDAAGANNADYTITFNFEEFATSSKTITLNTTAKTVFAGNYTNLAADNTISVDKATEVTFGTDAAVADLSAGHKVVVKNVGTVNATKGTIPFLTATESVNTINVNGATLSYLNSNASNTTVNVSAGTVNSAINAKSGIINISGGSVKGTTTAKAATVNITGGTFVAESAVTTTTGAINIKPETACDFANTFTTTSGKVTIDNKLKAVAKVVILGTTDVALDNGIITAIEYTGGATKAAATTVTVTSKGTSAIKNATTTASTYANVTYSSSFNGGNDTAVSDQFGDPIAAIEGNANAFTPIYTAAQLAGINGNVTKAFVLMTDITKLEKWTSPVPSKGLMGNNKTISSIDAPLFGAITTNIYDLTINGVDIVSTDETHGVGAVAKSTSENLSISNVKVAGSISGHYYVGGFVGKVTAGRLRIVGESEVDVTLANTIDYASTPYANDDEAGTFGAFVGAVTGSGELGIASSTNKSSALDKSKKGLKFSYNRTLGAKGVITGYFKGASDLVGYSKTTSGANNAIAIGDTKYSVAGTVVENTTAKTKTSYSINAVAAPTLTDAEKTAGWMSSNVHLNLYVAGEY